MREVAHHREVASHWRSKWGQIADPCDLPTNHDVVMLSRVGLLTDHVVSQVSTVNGHSGSVPAMHDPDRVEWAILEQMPFGSTAMHSGQQIQ